MPRCRCAAGARARRVIAPQRQRGVCPLVFAAAFRRVLFAAARGFAEMCRCHKRFFTPSFYVFRRHTTRRGVRRAKSALKFYEGGEK